MNKTFRAISVLLAISILLSFGMIGFAADDTLNFTITNLEVFADGSNIGSVQNGNMTVKASLKATEAQTPLIMALLCDGTEDYYNVASSSYVDDIPFDAGETKTVEIPLNCSDKTNKFIKIMVFDSYASMHLEAESAIFPTGDEGKVKSVTINGELVKGFDKDTDTYDNVQAPYAAALPLNVEVTTVAEGAEVTVTQPSSIPGKLVIQSGFEGEEIFTYTINLIEGQPLMVDYFAGGDVSKINIVKNMNSDTYRYSDKTADFSWALPEGLAGSTYLQPSYNDWIGSKLYTANNSERWMEFTIKKPATVYYLTTTGYVGASCQNFVNGWLADGWTWMTTDGKEPDTKNASNAWTVNSDKWMYSRLFLLKKDIDASPEKPVTISAKTMGDISGTPVYSFAVQWKTDALDLTDIKINGSTVKGFAPEKLSYDVFVPSADYEISATAADSAASVHIQKPAALPGDATITVSKDGKSRVYTLHIAEGELEPEIKMLKYESSGDYTIGYDLQIGTPMFYNNTNRAYADFGGLPFEGAAYIAPYGDDWSNPLFNIQRPESGQSVAAMDWITFRINKSANVYIVNNLNPTSNGKYMGWLQNWEKVRDYTDASTVKDAAGEAKSVFKKTFHVEPGETATIALQNMGLYGNRMYSVVVEWLEDTSYLNLKNIKIDGSEIPDFDAETLEYNDVQVASSSVITAEATDSSAVVTVSAMPESLPGDVTITVAKDGKNRIYVLHLIQKTYEPKVTNLKTAGPDAVTLVEGFGTGTKRWTDYPVLWDDMDGLTFQSDNCYYIQTAFKNAVTPADYQQDKSEGWITFDINRSANVYVLYGGGNAYGSADYLPGLAGWEQMKKADDSLYRIKTQNANTGSLYYAKYTSAFVYKKTFDVPGEGENVRTVSLTYGGLKGAYNYNVIVEFIDDAAEPDLSLSGITVGGESISGFDANITEYNVEVESLDTEILGTAADSTAKVTLSKPSSLPGDATITVTKDGKSKVYTLHLTQKETGRLTIDYYGGQAASEPFDINVIEHMTESTQRYSDERTNFANGTAPAELFGSTYLQPAFNKTNTNADYLTPDGDSWLKFTLREPATVYYLTDTQLMTTTYQNFLNGWVEDGWTWMTTDGKAPSTAAGSENFWTLNSNGGTTSWTKTRLFLLKKQINASEENPVTIDGRAVGAGGKEVVYSFAIKWKESGAEEALPGQVTNIQSAASMPNLIEGFGIGTKRWSNTGSTWNIHTWANLDGFTVNSANSYYLQCNFSDWDTDNFKQSKSEGWLSFDVNRSANIYVILATNGSGVGGASAYPGLNAANGWEKMTKADGTDLKITTASYVEGTSYGRTDTILRVGYVYKKNVTLPADGESVQNISLPYGGTYAYGNYGVLVEFTDSAE